jgi:type IV secretion system protein VirD4
VYADGQQRFPHDGLSYAQATSRHNDHGVYLGADSAGGLVFGRPEEAALVLGPPRSGKTTAIVVPNVLAACGPVLVASTKRDILDVTWRARQRTGRCGVFDPGGSVEVPANVASVGWSPLHSSATFDGALLVVEAMVGAARPGAHAAESHWVERASALLAPIFHAAAIDGRSLREVVSWVDRHELSGSLAILSRADASRACEVLSGIQRTEEREQSGIWSTASGVLAAYRSEAALRTSEMAPLDPAAFVDPANGANTLYICASGQHQRYAAPLVAGLVEDVRAATYAKRGGPPTLAVLDELANIAPLADLPKIVSEGGSQGLLVLACLQDLSQARARWGQEADGFLSLFGTKVLLPGIGDMRTLEAVSALCGDHDVAVRSTTRAPLMSSILGKGHSRSTTTTWATRRQRRVPVDEVAKGLPGGALVVTGGREVATVRLTPHHEHGLWRDASGLSSAGRARIDLGGPLAGASQARQRPSQQRDLGR